MIAIEKLRDKMHISGAANAHHAPVRLQRVQSIPTGTSSRRAGKPYKAAFEGRFAGERFDGTDQLGAQEKVAISRAQ
ncbi:MAG TPA: hypothetical protein VLC73_18405 [Burkholderiales bacterium]|nr:hypothetical protein [Burkholderiales bacterium]